MFCNEYNLHFRMKNKLIIQNDVEVHHIREAKNAVLNTGT